MKKLMAGGVGLGVFVVVLLVALLVKSKAPEAQAQGASPGSSAGGKVVVDVEEPVTAKAESKATRTQIPPAKPSSAGEVDLSGLESKDMDLEEREIVIKKSRQIKDKDHPGRVKGIALTLEGGEGVVFWNESSDSKFQNSVLAGTKLVIGKKYKVLGKESRPYRGIKQFEIREFVK